MDEREKRRSRREDWEDEEEEDEEEEAEKAGAEADGREQRGSDCVCCCLGDDGEGMDAKSKLRRDAQETNETNGGQLTERNGNRDRIAFVVAWVTVREERRLIEKEERDIR